jgi:hypothetical protein
MTDIEKEPLESEQPEEVAGPTSHEESIQSDKLKDSKQRSVARSAGIV